MSELGEVASAEEAASFLRMDPEKLKRLARAKRIGHLRAGRQYLFPREAIETYVRENTIEALPVNRNPLGLTDSAYQRLLRQRRD